MTANDKVLGYIRTGIPYLIGLALAWVYAHFALDLRGDFQVALIAFTVPAVTNLYYIFVRLVEVRFPFVGVFLGWPKTPEYTEVGNLWASLVRTGIPTVVGAVVVTIAAWIAQSAGYVIDTETQAGTILIAVAVVEAAYYSLARLLLGKFPGLAFLLGGAYAPSYPAGLPAV